MTGRSLVLGSNRFHGLRPTVVYDSYWRFAAERQSVFFRRLSGAHPPWTSDPILLRHKFTNAYRASDRVSQYLIRDVIYNPAYPSDPKEVVFRVLLFKLFNKINTWKLLEEKLGLLTWAEFKADRYDQELTKAFASGTKLYSAAYIMPPVRIDGSDGVKHRGHLSLLEKMMRDGVTARLQDSRSLGDVFTLLKTYPSLGNFLAFQLAIDLNYSNVIDHGEDTFVVAGPGAHDGLSKVFENAAEFDAEALIELVADAQEREFENLGLKFQSLFGRPLQLIDCQNLFCEISKYSRVAHPEIAGAAGRTRIKQIFTPAAERLQVWYPPKWGLNNTIADFASEKGDIR